MNYWVVFQQNNFFFKAYVLLIKYCRSIVPITKLSIFFIKTKIT